MTDCDYELRGDKFVCTTCGDVRAKLVRRNCPGADHQRPPKPISASFAVATKKFRGCC